jgi:asparagine synthase (glutamine-hydrolysing)
MATIAGIFHLQTAKPVDPGRVAAISAAMGTGAECRAWTAPGVGLATEASEGALLTSGDGRWAVLIDGMICNAAELRAELDPTGTLLRTSRAAEIVLHAWRKWGAACLDRLDGEFAFAVHDRDGATLTLVRDRLGVKPLHYAELADGSVVFASELKGLVAHPLLRRVPDAAAIEDYLALGYVPDDSCIVRGVRKLSGGSVLAVRRASPMLEPRRWWQPDFSRSRRGSSAALAEELADLMRHAVRGRMSGDQQVGACLAGDVASSAVVALMAEVSKRAIETASIGDGQSDEAVAGVVARFATRHREVPLQLGDPSIIDRLAIALDEPFADPSALAALRLGLDMRGRVSVALSGDGADLLFSLLPHQRPLLRDERWRRLIPLSLRQRLPALNRDRGELYAEAVMLTPPRVRAGIFSADFSRQLRGHRVDDRYVKTFFLLSALPQLDRLRSVELLHHLPAASLALSDRLNRAAGLEVRHPLIDLHLVSFAASLPRRWRSGRDFGLMRRAMRRSLPPEILTPHRKPIRLSAGPWLTGPFASELDLLIRRSAMAETGWFDMAAVAELVTEHRAGRADQDAWIWQILMLDKSLRHLFGLGR